MWYVHYYMEGVERLFDFNDSQSAWRYFIAVAIWKPRCKAWLEWRK
ncbi:hypothetical protein ES704_02079 [subsurface metagenome]|jgi:hypothetical protein